MQVDGKRKYDSFQEEQGFSLSPINNRTKKLKSNDNRNCKSSVKGENNVASFIKRDPCLVKDTTVVSDVYLAPSANIIKGDLLCAVQYILDQNVPVSKLNQFCDESDVLSQFLSKCEVKKLQIRMYEYIHSLFFRIFCKGAKVNFYLSTSTG